MNHSVLYTGNLSTTVSIGERVAFRLGDLAARDQCNVGIVLAGDGLLLVDSPKQSPDEEIIREAEAYFKKPVTHILFTHAHHDHRNGLASLHRRDIRLIASQATLQRIGELFPDNPCPREAVRSGDSLTLGGVPLSFWEPPLLPAHSPWDLLITLPEDGVVFTGDFLVPPFFQYTHACLIENWVAGLKAFAGASPAKTALMGHGEPEDAAAALTRAIAYTEALAGLFGQGGKPDSTGAAFRQLAALTDDATVLRQLQALAAGPTRE